eukprot:scaffold7344_cov242-Pinguiococcus_pyrenoidosus.AAC.5
MDDGNKTKMLAQQIRNAFLSARSRRFSVQCSDAPPPVGCILPRSGEECERLLRCPLPRESGNGSLSMLLGQMTKNTISNVLPTVK